MFALHLQQGRGQIKTARPILVFGCVPRGDIWPTDLGPVIIPEHDGFACQQMAWGWRVPWGKQPLINAKSETITQLPTFKPHLQNRCLILADGFFEKGIRFIQPGGPLFAMAGLCQPDAAGSRFTMLTTTPNASVSPYHHRMPFILRAEQLGAWLGDDWLAVLENPDQAPLDKIQKQPELF